MGSVSLRTGILLIQSVCNDVGPMCNEYAHVRKDRFCQMYGNAQYNTSCKCPSTARGSVEMNCHLIIDVLYNGNIVTVGLFCSLMLLIFVGFNSSL